MSPQRLQQQLQQWLKSRSPQQEVQQQTRQNIRSTSAKQLELNSRQWAQAFCIPQIRRLTMQPQEVPFCFATKTTQKSRLLQVSCSLLIRATQQLRRRLTHRILCFMPKSDQQLRQRPTHRIFCCFSFKTIQPIPSFIWLLRSFQGLRLPKPLLKVSFCFATKTTQ